MLVPWYSACADAEQPAVDRSLILAPAPSLRCGRHGAYLLLSQRDIRDAPSSAYDPPDRSDPETDSILGRVDLWRAQAVASGEWDDEPLGLFRGFLSAISLLACVGGFFVAVTLLVGL